MFRHVEQAAMLVDDWTNFEKGPDSVNSSRQFGFERSTEFQSLDDLAFIHEGMRRIVE